MSEPTVLQAHSEDRFEIIGNPHVPMHHWPGEKAFGGGPRPDWWDAPSEANWIDDLVPPWPSIAHVAWPKGKPLPPRPEDLIVVLMQEFLPNDPVGYEAAARVDAAGRYGRGLLRLNAAVNDLRARGYELALSIEVGEHVPVGYEVWITLPILSAQDLVPVLGARLPEVFDAPAESAHARIKLRRQLRIELSA